MTAMRTLFIATGAALLGAYIHKSASASSSSRAAALPRADGPVAGDTAPYDHDGEDNLSAASDLQGSSSSADLELGMPSDMSNDSDRARPGFADYARGA